jgi:hypothetical protein
MPTLPPRLPWLAGAKAGFGIDESNPVVVRILEILHRNEISPVSVEEQREFWVLNDELIDAHEAIHGKRIHFSG